MSPPTESRLAKALHTEIGTDTVPPMHPWVFDRLPLMLLLADLAALGTAAVIAGAPPLRAQLFVLGAVAVFQVRHLYRARVTLALTDDLLSLCGGTVAAVVFSLLLRRPDSGTAVVDHAVTLALAAAVMVVTVRAAVYGTIRAARRRGWVSHRAVVVGTDETAVRLAASLKAHPDLGLRVVGFVGEVDSDAPEWVRSAVLTSDPEAIPALTKEHQASVVLMTGAGVDRDEVLQSLRAWGPPGGLTLFLVPPLFQMLHGSGFDRVRDMVLIPIRASVSRRLAWHVKAFLDRAAAALMLLLLAPLMVAVAAAVRWETGPGVLFKQTRVGLGGRPFTLYKFRSLRPATETESAQNWSVAQDDRLGPVGRFIRMSSLDELPQLFNVLKGEMSLVGPRPERPYFVEQFGNTFQGYALRHRVRPGLTGWAAVNGLRGDTSIQERAYFDNVYIDNWSLQFDFKILALTALAVVKGTGA